MFEKTSPTFNSVDVEIDDNFACGDAMGAKAEQHICWLAMAAMERRNDFMVMYMLREVARCDKLKRWILGSSAI